MIFFKGEYIRFHYQNSVRNQENRVNYVNLKIQSEPVPLFRFLDFCELLL